MNHVLFEKRQLPTDQAVDTGSIQKQLLQVLLTWPPRNCPPTCSDHLVISLPSSLCKIRGLHSAQPPGHRIPTHPTPPNQRPEKNTLNSSPINHWPPSTNLGSPKSL